MTDDAPLAGARDAGATRGRLLAVDYGDRRVGLALSDPLGMIATPLDAIVRRPGKRPPVAEIIRRAEAAEARGFVVGLPLDGAGEDSPRTVEARLVASQLVQRTALPTYLVDERYTTAAALRTIRELGGTTRGRKGDVDAMAAAVLLRHALALGDVAFDAARVHGSVFISVAAGADAG